MTRLEQVLADATIIIALLSVALLINAISNLSTTNTMRTIASIQAR